MADIFISYSKADRDKVLMLSAYLESEGWTVWWDKNLNPGEPYRDEIMRQLVTARAVIVLWTPNSIKSDFVRAEAGRAKADSKLIPVKTDDVAYGDIPLPFGEMHTESLANKGLIRAAVVAQLAKPHVQPSALWVTTKTLRYQVLTWLGIIGGAITVFSGLRGALDLAVWANWVINYWQAWSYIAWQWLFSLFQISIPPGLAPILSFTLFGILIAAGQRALHATTQNGNPADSPAFTLREVNESGIIALVLWALFFGLGGSDYLLLAQIALMSIFVIPPLYLVLQSRYRLYCLASLTLTALFFVIIVVVPLMKMERAKPPTPMSLSLNLEIPVAVYLTLCIIPGIMLSIAPARALTKRLSFLALGVLILIGLNEISKHVDSIRGALKMTT